MPAISVELSSEVLATLGKIPDALRSAQKELTALERKLSQAASKGGKLDQGDLERAEKLRSDIGSYTERVKRRKEIEQGASNAVRRVMGGPTDRAPVTAAQTLTTSNARLFGNPMFEKAVSNSMAKVLVRNGGMNGSKGILHNIGSLLSTHNPHGTLRNIANGNANRTVINELLGKIPGGGMAAGGAFLALSLLKMADNYALAANAADQKGEAMRLATTGERFAMLRGQRFNTNPAQTEFFMQLHQAAMSPVAHPKGVYGAVFTHGDYDAEVQKSRMNEIIAKKFGLNAKWEDYKNNPTIRDMHSFSTIVRKNGGSIASWLWAKTVGEWSGENEVEANKAATAMHEAHTKNAQRRVETDAKLFYENNPNEYVRRVAFDRQLDAGRQMRFERFTDWNKF